MNPWLTQLVHTTNGRPFTDAELGRIGTYVELLPDRLTALKKLEESQKWLVRHLADYIAPKAIEWGLPKDPFSTDFVQFLAALGYAMLCDDMALVEHSVVQPCCDLADALEIPREEIALLFETTWDALSPRLDPRSVSLLDWYFQSAANQLRSQVPVGV